MGEYATAKAEATAEVLACEDLWCVVVHPSGKDRAVHYRVWRLTLQFTK